MTIPVPNGYDAVLRTFGDIRQYIRGDGTLNPRWEEERVSRIALPASLRYATGGGQFAVVTRITVHKLIADTLAKALHEIFDQGLWAEIDPYGGGYIFRSIRGAPGKVSMHSFAIAWDFRPEHNRQGTDGTMHPRVVAIMEKYGFFWGGRFHGDRKDPMHFQYAVNA